MTHLRLRRLDNQNRFIDTWRHKLLKIEIFEALGVERFWNTATEIRLFLIIVTSQFYTHSPNRLSLKMVETYFACILPGEWLMYPFDELEPIINQDINNYWRYYQTMAGITFSRNGVTIMIFNYKNQLWFRRVENANDELTTDYFMIYLNLDLM